MIIRKSKQQYALCRYGGVSDGKNIEVRVGTVPLGTKPDCIPGAIVMDLTPRELNELKDVLVHDHRELLGQKLAAVEVDLKEIVEAVKAGVLDELAITKACVAARELIKAQPKSKSRIGSVNEPTVTDIPLPLGP